ncbi:MAG: acyl--CoA ligase [Spirochaetales bacterium]|nr:acyl--CoA ligase [Spirochaetales bacterium]
MDIFKYIQEQAKRDARKIAVHFDDSALDYAALWNKVDLAAGFLHSQGLKKNDRVAIWLPNGIENIVYFLAILKIGCIEVNLSNYQDMKFVLHALKETTITALICNGMPEFMLMSILESIESVRFIITDQKINTDIPVFSFITANSYVNQGDNVPPPEISDPAMIMYTSGSTSRPRGIVLSQENFIYASKERIKLLNLSGNDRILNILNPSHSCSKSLIFDALYLGANLILGNGFLPPFYFLHLLLQQKPTIITGSPLLFHYFLKLKNNQKAMNSLKTHLRYLEIGLSRTTNQMFIDLHTAFPWAKILNRYGLTENAGAACITDCFSDSVKIGSIGKIGATDSIKIDNLTLNPETSCREGEIRLIGKKVMLGYWDQLKESQQPLSDDGVLTGDYVSVDDEGNIFYIGRKDDLVKVSGEKVNLNDIEKTASGIEGIDEVVVFAVEDDSAGYKIILYYYSESNLPVEAVKTACHMELDKKSNPHEFHMLTSPLAKTASGKFDRIKIKQNFLKGNI